MSCGAGLPSRMYSPFSMGSPSCRWNGLPFGIRYSTGSSALVGRLDDDAALVLVVASEADRAVDLGDDRVVLGTTSLEQFGHTRQTAGDVLGLGAFERDTRQHVARRHLLARLDRDDRVHRRAGSGHRRHARPWRPHPCGRWRGPAQAVAALVGPPVDDDALGEARGLVGGFRDRSTVDQILEHHLAFDFGQDRTGVGIPFGDTLAALDLVAFLDPQLGAVGRRLWVARSLPSASRMAMATLRPMTTSWPSPRSWRRSCCGSRSCLRHRPRGTSCRPPAPCHRCGTYAW